MARLWCRKSSKGREFEAGLRQPTAGKHCQPIGELGKDKAARGEGWALPSLAVPKIQWNSNPHCPYGYLAMGNL